MHQSHFVQINSSAVKPGLYVCCSCFLLFHHKWLSNTLQTVNQMKRVGRMSDPDGLLVLTSWTSYTLYCTHTLHCGVSYLPPSGLSVSPWTRPRLDKGGSPAGGNKGKDTQTPLVTYDLHKPDTHGRFTPPPTATSLLLEHTSCPDISSCPDDVLVWKNIRVTRGLYFELGAHPKMFVFVLLFCFLGTLRKKTWMCFQTWP